MSGLTDRTARRYPRRYHVSALFAALAFVNAAGAHAADWHGVWSHDLDWCMPAEKIGTTIPAPVLYTADKVTGYENFCDVDWAEPLDAGLTRVSLTCEAEGETYEEMKYLTVQGDTMWVWAVVEGFEPTMTEFRKCPG